MDYEFLKNKVFDTLGFHYNGTIQFEEHPGFRVSCADGSATVGAESPAALCRALCEMAQAISSGKDRFHIEKSSHFTWCGPMLDVSREGVFRVEQIKKYIDMIACLGMNMLMLYTEDVYEMEKYPFFGYKRGRYTLAELKEADDYAYSMGVELIPCIQTLGHLESYLCWAESAPVKDTRWSILPGDEKSLAFVEDMLITCKKAFRSKNIHIGMDEAVWAGTGAYFKKHRGEVIDQTAIIFDHLKKVCKLCEKYDYNPIIWSDLFFVDEKIGEMYTENAKLPEEYSGQVPANVRFMYWEYHAEDKNLYRAVLKNHKESGNPIAYAGTGWNYESFTPNTVYGFKTCIPGLKACIEENCDMVLNTLWSCCGETSLYACFPSNALFAEYMWSGADASEDDAWAMNEFLTGTPKKLYDAADALHCGLEPERRMGRKLLRMDVLETVRAQDTGFLHDNFPDVFHGEEPMQSLFAAADEIRDYISENGDRLECFTTAEHALRTSGYKAYIHAHLWDAYKNNNTEELTKICSEILPLCRESYKNLYTVFGQQWKKEYKSFGWEWHCQRVGFQIARIDYAIDMLTQYLNREISCIEELEIEPLNQNIYFG